MDFSNFWWQNQTVMNSHFQVILDKGDQIKNSALAAFPEGPGVIWYKNRANVDYHQIDTPLTFDAVDTLRTPQDTGFSGGWVQPNAADDCLAWCWRCDEDWSPAVGGGNVLNSARRNVEAGFSVARLSNAGNNPVTTNNTVAHGLSKTPELVIFPNVNYLPSGKTGSSPRVWMPSFGTQQTLSFDIPSPLLSPTMAYPTAVDATNVTHTSFTVGADFLIMAFHSVEGFSSFGTYTGNGAAEGPTIDTGFSPDLVVVKSRDVTGEWVFYTPKTNPSSTSNFVSSNSTSPENTDTGVNNIEILSNGFKIKNTTAIQDTNQAGQVYVYAAFNSRFVTLP